MTANFDADSPDNWLEIFSNSYEATYIPGRTINVYRPIPPTELSLNIDSPLIAVYCSSTQYPDSQRYLGRINRQIKLPESFPTETALDDSRALYSNQTVLMKSTEFNDSYSLLLTPRAETEQVTVTIYQYVGSAFFELDNRLNEINSKLDLILESLVNESTETISATEETAILFLTNFI